MKKKALLSKRRQKTVREQKKRRLNTKDENEEIISTDEDADEFDAISSDQEEPENDAETADEKRFKLAKDYISQLKETILKADDDDENEASNRISLKLKEEYLSRQGKLKRAIASTILEPKLEKILKGHKKTVTCAVLSAKKEFVFSSSKDGVLIKWSFETGKRLFVLKRGPKVTGDAIPVVHFNSILCLALSTDDKFLASGDARNFIMIWNPIACTHLHTFKGHYGAVTGLCFPANSHQLFSCSLDKTIKIWNLDEFAYVETLYGHESGISDITSSVPERCITVGGLDNSLRQWKIVEESHLIYHGHKSSADCVSVVNEDFVVTGSQDGSIACWNLSKKNPVYLCSDAHSDKDAIEKQWISSVCALKNTDLIASGSSDGCIRLWQCAPYCKELKLLYKIPVCGVVNRLQFSADGHHLIASVGQEHRLGRWWFIREAKNLVYIWSLPSDTTSAV